MGPESTFLTSSQVMLRLPVPGPYPGQEGRENSSVFSASEKSSGSQLGFHIGIVWVALK